jgi:hypothetical protein
LAGDGVIPWLHPNRLRGAFFPLGKPGSANLGPGVPLGSRGPLHGGTQVLGPASPGSQDGRVGPTVGPSLPLCPPSLSALPGHRPPPGPLGGRRGRCGHLGSGTTRLSKPLEPSGANLGPHPKLPIGTHLCLADLPVYLPHHPWSSPGNVTAPRGSRGAALGVLAREWSAPPAPAPSRDLLPAGPGGRRGGNRFGFSLPLVGSWSSWGFWPAFSLEPWPLCRKGGRCRWRLGPGGLGLGHSC